MHTAGQLDPFNVAFPYVQKSPGVQLKLKQGRHLCIVAATRAAAMPLQPSFMQSMNDGDGRRGFIAGLHVKTSLQRSAAEGIVLAHRHKLHLLRWKFN
jgi:hypothetical protein